MNYRTFISQNRQDWKRLENLIHTLQQNKKKWTAGQVEDFQRTYQKVTQHLAFSQTYFPEEESTDYLNTLTSKAHNTLYQEQTSNWKQVKHLFGHTFIHLLREQWAFVIISMCLFLLGGTAAFTAVYQDPMSLYTILPANIAQNVDPSQIGSDGGVNSPVMSAEILTNNIQVAFLAFAGGVTFGLVTVYVLIFNGIIVGALAALFFTYGKSYDFWAYIVPHGIIELTAIFIAGGAGLLMGFKLWVPGSRTRAYQLKTNAYRSVLLLIGTLPLFIIAGIIEGYITPSALPLEAKYAFAALTVIGLLVYIVLGSRPLKAARGS